MICDIGDPVELKALATNRKTGEALKPDKVVCTVEQPDGTTQTPTIEEGDDPKEFLGFVTATEAKKWRFAFDFYDADGEPIGSAEGEFKVREREIAR